MSSKRRGGFPYLSTALFGPPMPVAVWEREPSQVRTGFRLHDLHTERDDRPVLTEWRLSIAGRIMVLLTGRIITTIWNDRSPPMSVEHSWPNVGGEGREPASVPCTGVVR